MSKELPVPGKHRMQRASTLDLEKTPLGVDTTRRGEPSRLAAGREHAMTRYDDGERIAPERLPHGTRETHVAETDGDVAVCESLAERNRTGFNVDTPSQC